MVCAPWQHLVQVVASFNDDSLVLLPVMLLIALMSAQRMVSYPGLGRADHLNLCCGVKLVLLYVRLQRLLVHVHSLVSYEHERDAIRAS